LTIKIGTAETPQSDKQYNIEQTIQNNKSLVQLYSIRICSRLVYKEYKNQEFRSCEYLWLYL